MSASLYTATSVCKKIGGVAKYEYFSRLMANLICFQWLCIFHGNNIYCKICVSKYLYWIKGIDPFNVGKCCFIIHKGMVNNEIHTKIDVFINYFVFIPFLYFWYCKKLATMIWVLGFSSNSYFLYFSLNKHPFAVKEVQNMVLLYIGLYVMPKKLK